MRHLTLVGLLGLALLLPACGWSTGPQSTPTPRPNPYTPLRDLRADPAGMLRLPTSDYLAGGGEERFTPAFGQPSPASLLGTYGTPAPQEEVFAFYDRELRVLGFAFIPNGSIPGSTETVVWSWCRPGARYRLSIREQARGLEPTVLQGRTYRTVFDARLIGRDHTPCRT